jgi:hypothetical protein
LVGLSALRFSRCAAQRSIFCRCIAKPSGAIQGSGDIPATLRESLAEIMRLQPENPKTSLDQIWCTAEL